MRWGMGRNMRETLQKQAGSEKKKGEARSSALRVRPFGAQESAA